MAEVSNIEVKEPNVWKLECDDRMSKLLFLFNEWHLVGAPQSFIFIETMAYLTN